MKQAYTNNEVFLGHMIAGTSGHSLTLDTIDKKILLELSLNARAPYTSIAKHIGISREQVTYRIERLLQKEILTGTLTLINPRVFNARIYELYLRIKSLTTERKQELTAYFVQHPKTQWVATCGSSYDYALTLLCTTLEEFDDTLSSIKEHIGENLVELLVHPVLYEEHTWKPYIEELYSPEQIFKKFRTWKGKDDGSYQKYFVERIHHNSSPLQYDAIDKKIIRAIERDARKTMIQISQETKLSYDTIKKHLKELILQGTIQSFIPVISAPLLGFQWNLVFLNINTYNKKRILALETTLHSHPSIAYISRVTASSTTYVLSLMVKDAQQYNDILQRLRTQYADIIKTYEHLIIFESHKYTPLTALL